MILEKDKLMQLEIEKKRKLPKNIKDSINTNIFQNLVVALIIMIYLCAINITYYKVNATHFEWNMKYYALGISIITVITIEIAYRKNSLKFTVISIELLLCGILSLYIPYIYLHTTQKLRISVMILPAILVFYYAIKSIAIFKQKQLHYQNNLSDVKEIVNINDKKSYLDEESKKTYREKTIQEEEIRKVIIKEQKVRSMNRSLEKTRQEVEKRNRTVVKQ